MCLYLYYASFQTSQHSYMYLHMIRMVCVTSTHLTGSEESHIAADILGDSSSDLRHPGPGSHNKPSDGGPEDETNSVRCRSVCVTVKVIGDGDGRMMVMRWW